ncbi:unnamed protein product, partial [Aphanomyces euteiches]
MNVLTELFETCPESEEVSLRQVGLHSLDALIPVLKQFRELRHLDVSHNQLTQLPNELADLARLVALDVSNNPLGPVKRLISVFTRLPSLKSLSISLADPSDEQLLLVALPKLRILNGTPLHGPDMRQQSPPSKSIKTLDSALPAEYVQNVASILNVLKGVGQVVPPNSDEDHRVTRMFEQQVELIGMSLKHETQDQIASSDKHTAELLLAKFKIAIAGTSYATQKAGECVPEMGLAWQTLCLLQQDIVTSFYNLTLELIQNQATNASAPAGNPMQLKQLLEVAETLEADVQRGAQALAMEQKKVGQLQEEVNHLRADLAVKPSCSTNTPPKDTTSRSPSVVHRPSSTKCVASAKEKIIPPSPSSTMSAPPAAPTTVKNLTLKQLKDLIEAIYASKRKYDQMNIEAKAPRETMEQHMYTYLNQRFGLHALIVEYASAIMKGCARYSSVDCDVATFLHILRNELDEGYLRLKLKLEETVVALLRAFLRGLYPRKSEGTITQKVQAKLTSATALTRDEWQSIVTYMYDTQDSTSILHLIETRLKQSHESTVDYPVFRKILLNYQMRGRLKLLEEFRRHFDNVDRDKVGILKRSDFVDLVLALTPYKTQDEIAQILKHLDPHEHDCITFSDAVETLFKDIRALRLKALAPSPISSTKPVPPSPL